MKPASFSRLARANHCNEYKRRLLTKSLDKVPRMPNFHACLTVSDASNIMVAGAAMPTILRVTSLFHQTLTYVLQNASAEQNTGSANFGDNSGAT